MNRQIARVGAVLVLGVLGGCVPQSLRTIAQQNETNLKNLARNNELLAAALKGEVELHVALQVHASRARVANRLAEIGGVLPSSPTDAQLADDTQAWYRSLADDVGTVAARLQDLEPGSSAYISIAAANPCAADIATERPGFTVPRVLRDSVTLIQLDSKISGEDDDMVREALFAKRHRLLDAYGLVEDQADLGREYLAAVDSFIGTVREQDRIAQTHAASFVAYSQAAPAVETLASAAGDQELRRGVLEIVARRKGQEFADRLKANLAKADRAIDIARSLGGQ